MPGNAVAGNSVKIGGTTGSVRYSLERRIVTQPCRTTDRALLSANGDEGPRNPPLEKLTGDASQLFRLSRTIAKIVQREREGGRNENERI